MATDLGKVGMVTKGDWNSSATYEVLDVVSYQDGLYVAKQAVPANTLPTNTTYWQPGVKTKAAIARYRIGNGNTGAITAAQGSLVIIARSQSATKGLLYIDSFGAIVELIQPSNVTYSISGSTLSVTNSTGSNLDATVIDMNSAPITQL